MNKKICVGILAHVDAGKTTLCESILFLTDMIRKKGRVDTGNTFFDYNPAEILHGITVLSKEATFIWNNTQISIIDTPGHHDFKSEVERVIPIIDIFLFVVSASEIDKPQNSFLFQQLVKYNKPIVIFVSKMDMDRIGVNEGAKQFLSLYSEKCIPYSKGELEPEAAATIDDYYFNAYLENKSVPVEHTYSVISNKDAFPVIFGSGLKGDGVEDLLNLLCKLSTEQMKDDHTSVNKAYIYKIDRDSKGIRQVHIKILSGRFSVRDEIAVAREGAIRKEKINEIRQLNGARFTNMNSAQIGDIVAVTGLTAGRPGETIGAIPETEKKNTGYPKGIEYVIMCPENISQTSFLNAIRILEEEDPSLAFTINDFPAQSIKVHLSGELQKEVLGDTFFRRFQIPIRWGSTCVEYYETITDTVIGNGHYEPLRHYAEVRVKLSPMPSGSGIIIDSQCPDTVLDSNWQNVILNSLRSFRIRGVLTGSDITDLHISLLSGKYHVKHTEGGDFREAAIRAVRQGLMKANCVLLEPFASFVIICNTNNSGRIIKELEAERLDVTDQIINSEFRFEIHGKGSLTTVDALRKKYLFEYSDSVFFDYQQCGLAPCLSADAIIDQIGYDPDSDLAQSPDSVFCVHGAGHVVKWNESDAFMHIDMKEPRLAPGSGDYRYTISEKEINEILKKYALIETDPILARKKSLLNTPDVQYSEIPAILLIDGSNLLFAFSKYISKGSDDAELQVSLLKDQLVSDIINYIHYIGASAKIVFDGFSYQDQHEQELSINEHFSVLYSGSESADVVLERIAASIGPDYRCKMVTSDRMMQISALHSGITRISSREFIIEMEQTLNKMREDLHNQKSQMKNTINDIINK